MHDFTKDLLVTFPEYSNTLHKGLQAILDKKKDDPAVKEVYEHCQKIYPERFFDILYQKEELFAEEIFLLPDIDFSIIWKMEISDKTRTVIWKYLQLILFAIVHNEDDGESFGDTAKLFEAIDRLAVIGVSDWITNEAKSSFLSTAKIVQRIYNWIDLSEFYPKKNTEIRKKFAFIL